MTANATPAKAKTALNTFVTIISFRGRKYTRFWSQARLVVRKLGRGNYAVVIHEDAEAGFWAEVPLCPAVIRKAK